MREIGIIGLDFNSGNKGCEALAYGFLEILNTLSEKHQKKIKVWLLQKLPTKQLVKKRFNMGAIKAYYTPKYQYKNLDVGIIFLGHTSKKIFYNSKISKLDYVFDFTGGDSFSDIYGMQRFLERTNFKSSIIEHGVPLILGSQTIGPFESEEARRLAAQVISDCYEVFARDELSCDYAAEISGRKPILTTDVAFALPYKALNLGKTDKIRVGLNVSGLLWYGGYTGDNQFNLTVDYKKYCESVIQRLLDDGRYEIHLILHCFEDNNYNISDNDLVPTKELHERFPETIISPFFDSCIDAKSYISSMDVVVGARMHATIGAFSANVPVIPFAYSRKFEGLFNSIGYNYTLNARKLSTDDCIDLTLKYIENKDKILQNIYSGKKIIESKLNCMTDRLEEILFNEGK